MPRPNAWLRVQLYTKAQPLDCMWKQRLLQEQMLLDIRSNSEIHLAVQTFGFLTCNCMQRRQLSRFPYPGVNYAEAKIPEAKARCIFLYTFCGDSTEVEAEGDTKCVAGSVCIVEGALLALSCRLAYNINSSSATSVATSSWLREEGGESVPCLGSHPCYKRQR